MVALDSCFSVYFCRNHLTFLLKQIKLPLGIDKTAEKSYVYAVLSDKHIAGWSSPVARQAHNLKVVGSNPAPATKNKNQPLRLVFCF